MRHPAAAEDALQEIVTVTTHSEAETAAVAASLAAWLNRGDVVALEGGLGAGKTAFARAVVRAFCGLKTVVPSPTFTLVQTYETPNLSLWHCDLYRLAAADEVAELGLDEAFAEGLTLIEWPERLGDGLPDRRLHIRFSSGTEDNTRTLVFCGDARWRERLSGFGGEYA